MPHHSTSSEESQSYSQQSIKICGCHAAHEYCGAQVFEDPHESNIIVHIREEIGLDVPRGFFDKYDEKTTFFKIRSMTVTGQKIAIKWINDSHYCNFSEHMGYLATATNKTAEIISSFAKRVDMLGWKLRVVKTLVSEGPMEVGAEPYIKNVEKFNSNTFWETNQSKTYRKLVLAFAHFSFVFSRGEFVLTELKGGVDEEERVVTLLPPAIVSLRCETYGCSDLGNARNFCKYHTCNEICEDMPKLHGNNTTGGDSSLKSSSKPSPSPSQSPSSSPSPSPSESPSQSPSKSPSQSPSLSPSLSPSQSQTDRLLRDRSNL